MCCRQSGLINSAPILPCLTVRCAQRESGVSGRFTLLKYWTYLVSALNAWLCKVKYLDIIFAWLELRIQLVWINANKEMLFNHASHTAQLVWMSIREGNQKFLKFVIVSFYFYGSCFYLLQNIFQSYVVIFKEKN